MQSKEEVLKTKEEYNLNVRIALFFLRKSRSPDMGMILFVGWISLLTFVFLLFHSIRRGDS